MRQENLQRLLEAAKSGSYKAPPVRRVWIAKGDGNETRPIGIPTLEDKVLQRAVVMILEAIYEQDFVEASYGFRPNRSAHQALDAIWTKLSYREDGTPRGGVVSPILANIYLHHVLDAWFEEEVQPHLIGIGSLVRYADDAVLMFANESDARRVLTVLPKRFARFGLELHPTKTRLVHFVPPTKRGQGEQSTFSLLGFTHYWDKSQRRRWVIKRKTAKDRLKRSLKRVKQWCRQHRHDRLKEQHEALGRKLKGHYAYYGIIGNRSSLFRFRIEAVRIWVKWLGRRSQRRLNWAKAVKILQTHPLPIPNLWQTYRA